MSESILNNTRKIVTEYYRKAMDLLDLGGHFDFPCEDRNTVNHIMSVSFHMKPLRLNKKHFSISIIEGDNDYLRLTRMEDFEEVTGSDNK